MADILSSESLAQIAEKAWPEFERETGSSFVGEQEAEGKRIGTRTLYKLNKLSKNLIRTDEGTNKFKAYVSESRYETRQLLIEGSREVGNFDTASQEAVGEIKIEYLNSISPISRPESITAGLTNMPLASSQNVDLQRKLAGAGYVFQGYYRPMTLSAVIVSLIDRTETSGRNIAIKTLESMGVIAAALVGIDTFGATLTSRRFSQSVVIATGIIIPESRKRFWEDSSIYLKNLGNLALESTLELKANESRDGYVFFPKGAIYGFGIDEFSIQHPTYIVNIDRGSLAVEGKIIEASTRLNAGSNPGVSGISESTQLANSINEGQPRRESDELRLQDSVARVRVYEETRARNKVHALLEQGTPEEASKLLAVYKKIYGDSPEFRMLGERVSQFLDRGSLICLEASNEAKETSLVKLSQNADTTWTGVYKVRLSGPHASSAYSTIVESTLKLSNGDELASGKNISALTFTDAVWYKPQDLKLTITQEEKEKAEKQGLTVVHTIRSQDSRFSGQKTVEVSLPAVQ